MKIMTLYIKNSKRMRGGAYRRYMELIKGFLAEGWEVHHFSYKGFSSVKHSNFYHHALKKIRLKPSYFPFMLQVIPKSLILFRKKKIDAIVAFTIFDALIGIIIRFVYRDSRVIFCDRGDAIKGVSIDLKDKYHLSFLSNIIVFILELLEKFVYNSSDLVIFNSNVRKYEIMDKFSINKKIEVIYNNANPSWVTDKIENAYSCAYNIKKRWNDKKIICYVGNLFIEGRDLKTLLTSFKIVNETLPNSVLLIVGDGPDIKRLIEIRNNLGLEDVVFIEGWAENPFSYMLASDITIVTGLHEGCSNTLLEAIFFGRVILGSNVGGISKLLKYEELLFSPKNSKLLSKSILKLLNDENKYLNSKKLVEKRKNKFLFDWNREMIDAISEEIGR